jgi:hypothetical protein
MWDLPSPRRQRILRYMPGGWQTSGIWNWQSGLPLTITSGEDRSLSGMGNDNADVISKPGLSSGSRGEQIPKFTTESFRPAALGTFGNSGRNILTGPGTFYVDCSVLKNFAIRERFRLQYHAEFFNLFNNTKLNNPDSAYTSASFGRITGARDPRILQISLKVYSSQFEQQLRAVCGLPLGSTEQMRPAAMANLLGDLWSDGEPNWIAACAFPDVKLHLYGKTVSPAGPQDGSPDGT